MELRAIENKHTLASNAFTVPSQAFISSSYGRHHCLSTLPHYQYRVILPLGLQEAILCSKFLVLVPWGLRQCSPRPYPLKWNNMILDYDLRPQCSLPFTERKGFRPNFSNSLTISPLVLRCLLDSSSAGNYLGMGTSNTDRYPSAPIGCV